MVLIAAGAEAPGTKIVEFGSPFKKYSLSDLKFCSVSYKNFEIFNLLIDLRFQNKLNMQQDNQKVLARPKERLSCP